MAARSPRKSLESLFGDLKIARTRSLSSSPGKRSRGLKDTLERSLFHAGFPNNRTLKHNSNSVVHRREFTYTMNPEVLDYNERHRAASVNFNEARQMINEIHALLDDVDASQDTIQKYTNFTMESMAAVVFGSNMQEDAGLDHEETYRICMRIFNGEQVDPANIDPRSKEYQDNLDFLREQRGYENPATDAVIRSRQEIIQHAQAFKYIIDAALNRDQPLTEDLLKETHAILCQGEEYAGKYRTINVWAAGLEPGTKTLYTDWTELSWRMKNFVKVFNEDVEDRERTGNMDPFYLAADACQDFVCIHPFKDGNGRMCRLLLNAYLIKYAGVTAPIGESGPDREEYITIAKEAGPSATEEEARGKLGRFVLDKATIKLRALRDYLLGNNAA